MCGWSRLAPPRPRRGTAGGRPSAARSPARIIFSATSRFRLRCRALKTTPMPPRPIFAAARSRRRTWWRGTSRCQPASDRSGSGGGPGRQGILRARPRGRDGEKAIPGGTQQSPPAPPRSSQRGSRRPVARGRLWLRSFVMGRLRRREQGGPARPARSARPGTRGAGWSRTQRK